MKLNFEPISIDLQDRYVKYFSRVSQKGSDYSFINLWGWAEAYGLLWAWDEDLVWIRQTRPNEIMWAPVGAWDRIDWDHRFDQFESEPPFFTRLPEPLVEYWKRRNVNPYHFEEERGNWDYLYSVPELISLKGNRFHKKKNLLNQFLKKYNFRYIPIDPGWTEEALRMQNNWCAWRDCESSEMLDAENQVIEKILKYWEKLSNILGGAILIEGKMAAYTVGELLDNDTLVIHFEKGNQEYQGIYQAINQIFLSHQENRFQVVNREQDLDDPGLRKAKLSYNPIGYIRKYRAIHTRT